MCGIWASWGLRPGRSVIDSIAHRGPDGEGWREFDTADGPLVLAHRRLAILDVSDAGLQPMSSADGRWWVTYNGEIYNYLELRAELETLGHRFHTGTDTEVLIEAFMRWGPGCLDRLNGMFAFVMWDARDRRLVAARDRFGVKPIYFWSAGGRLALASEIKQLLELPQIDRRLHAGAAFDFLAAGGKTDHRRETQFDGIERLMGGEMLIMEVGTKPVIRRWYEPRPAADLPNSDRDRIERFGSLLEDSVRLRLRADVPVGACLSGGIDSSSIVCLAADLLQQSTPGNRMHSFSGCFEDPRIDERPHMRAVARHANTRSVEVYPTAGEFAAGLDRMVRLMDEPFRTPSIFLQERVFRAVHEAGIKVVLDGQGSDELLCGYHNMWTAAVLEFLWSFRVGAVTRELWAQTPLKPKRGTRLVLQGLRALLRGRRNYPTPAAAAFLSRDFLCTVSGDTAAGEPILLGDLVRHRLGVANLPALLRYEDRNSMGYGVEARVPFLDFRLVEFALALDHDQLLRGGVSKHVLRAAMRGRVPDTVLDRRDKLGFATPDHDWLAGALRQRVLDSIRGLPSRFPVVFDAAALDRHLDRCLAEPRPRSDVWRLFFFALWAESYGVSGVA